MLYEENAMEERERLCAKYGLDTIKEVIQFLEGKLKGIAWKNESFKYT